MISVAYAMNSNGDLTSRGTLSLTKKTIALRGLLFKEICQNVSRENPFFKKKNIGEFIFSGTQMIKIVIKMHYSVIHHDKRYTNFMIVYYIL